MDRDAVLDCYKRAVAKHDDIKIKGAKTSYTAINGNMFSFIDDQARICLRFSENAKRNSTNSMDRLMCSNMVRSCGGTFPFLTK